MNQGNNKTKSFTDLNAWKEGHKLVLKIYKITKDFPSEELFGLTNQLRRAVVSVTSNIAKDLADIFIKKNYNFIPWHLVLLLRSKINY